MNAKNHITLTGNLGATPELKTLASGDVVTTISLAIDMGYTDKDGKRVECTEWHRVVAWGRTAEIIASMDKGARVQLTGQLRSRSYTDSEGTTRFITEVKANNVMKIARRLKVAA